MSSRKAKKKVNDIYGSAKRGARQIVDSKEAHQLGAKARETMDSAGRGAKRVVGSQEVKDSAGALVRDTKEFAGAIYDAARGNPRKKSDALKTSQRRSAQPSLRAD